MSVKLTKRQRKLVKEIQEIADLNGLDYRDLADLDTRDRTFRLTRVRDLFIRVTVVSDYILIDQQLSSLIIQYFFRKRGNRFQRTKMYRVFSLGILEELFLLKKLQIVSKVHKMPKDIYKFITEMNSIRNALTHSLFPENLQKNKPLYKKKSIYSMEGFKAYTEGWGKTSDYLGKLVKR